MSALTSAAEAQPCPVALFVSDVHLQPEMPATVTAFLNFLHTHAAHVAQLYLLGDLFEYWAGDDDLDDPFHRRIVAALRTVSDGGTRVFWIAGNRDFLIGTAFAAATGATLLHDGSVVQIAGHSIVLAHGDAECTDDHGYIAFRNQVRQPAWQQQFLALPLAQRRSIIADMRMQSRDALRGKSSAIMDVNAAAIAALFTASATRCMIHGHTHRPATHRTPRDAPPEAQRVRHVLPDWDCDAAPLRGGWLSIDSDGVIQRHTVGAGIDA